MEMGWTTEFDSLRGLAGSCIGFFSRIERNRGWTTDMRWTMESATLGNRRDHALASSLG